MGQWSARGQCPTPTKMTLLKTTCLGLFLALRGRGDGDVLPRYNHAARIRGC